MTPAELAAAVYQREACPRSFREDLEAHLLHGYVIGTPTLFAMFRPVDSSAPYEQVTDPWHVFPLAQCDAWLIYLLAGELAGCMKWLPHKLPKIGFERNNVLRYYGFELLTRHAQRNRRTPL